MKFLVDAQLPRLLAVRLNELGQQATHTLDLPDGNSTKDRAIAELANTIDAVVITKDADFLNAHLIHGSSLAWKRSVVSGSIRCLFSGGGRFRHANTLVHSRK